MNESGNEYFRCRKRAAEYNEKLNSREITADLLGISPSALVKHELGITKSVPVDTVVMMADLYRSPELKNWYCKNECPIGKDLPVSTEVKDIREIAIRLFNSMDVSRITDLTANILQIAEDGKVSNEEWSKVNEAVTILNTIATVCSELKIFAQKNGGADHGTGK